MSAPVFNLPKVSAAIVTYNHCDPVLTLIASLEKQKIPTFVTENNGADNAAKAIREQFPNVSLLESPANLGGCGGFNCAMLAALSSGAEYIILIDDDALPDEDCIQQLSDFLDHHPDYVFVAPAIYITSKPDTLQEAGGGVDFSRASPIEAWYRFHIKPELPAVLDIDYASACCLMIRASALQEIGVMDWAFFIFSDDVDICLRLRKKFNQKGACLTNAKAVHDFPWGKPFAPMRLYFFQRNGLRLIANHQQGGKELKSLFAALMRLHRRIFYSRWIADTETHQTLKDAFKDAWRGKFGNWDKWITFAKDRQKIDADYFQSKALKKVLIDISIEDFLPAIHVLLSQYGKDLKIDLVCDQNRCDFHQDSGNYTQVFGRQAGFVKPLKIIPTLLKQRYDLVITDANMEARRPSAMAAKTAAFFHQDQFYVAANRPIIGVCAHLLSLPYGILMALLSLPRFRKPFPAGTPPKEAAILLEKIGIDAKIGQPFAKLSDE